MQRRKHRNDYNHGKSGMIGGNDRYRDQRRKKNPVHRQVSMRSRGRQS